MDPTQMAYFRTVCEEKSISQAAKVLYVSRQALSTSIKRLEAELGCELLERGRGGVEPTESGMLFLDYVRQQDRALLDCVSRMREAGLSAKRPLRVGMRCGLFDASFVRDILRFEEIDPGVSLEIVGEEVEGYWKMIEADQLDVAFTVLPPRSSGLDARPLQHFEQRILMSARNPLVDRDGVDFPRDLAGRTILETEGRMTAYEGILDRLAIRVKRVAADRHVVQALLVADKGFVITPVEMAGYYLCEGVVEKSLVGIPADMDLDSYLSFRPNPCEHVARFIDYVLSFYSGAANA